MVIMWYHTYVFHSSSNNYFCISYADPMDEMNSGAP